MRALAFQGYGDPSRVLRLTDLPRPEPGPGQVRVRLSARPINPSDLLFVQGSYGREARFTPRPDGGARGSGWAVAGFEGAGTVDALGPGTKGPAPGTRVAVSATGTWQEYVCVPGTSVIPVAHGVSTEAACQLTVNPFTAHLLVRDLVLDPGDTLLLTAGASAVSRMVIHLASERGVRCLPVVRHREQARALTRPGTWPLTVSSADALTEAVRDTVEHSQVGAVLDAVGGSLGDAALRCLRPTGRFVSYGMLSGRPLSMRPDDLVFRQVSVCGFWLPARMERLDGQELCALTREVQEAVVRGLPGLEIAERHDLADFRSALERTARPGRDGKVLLTG
ncbi:zinc-dependent alcohol dehydrogenase family protein [Streptomyces sp. TRM 70351]|uniref:zinc-dependent alcohol dehydrogenase family protein n=1 Tax=Streptomyces sp. TRM 70351 TaxID=3116552 RepID=UPI002E7C55AD|nr:zinc-dependent alcohol dehydrogenase family protein [Streptomyces sp. TRM 70351]MEE1928881.1 zinc-dependent alcohol dehydrogenase family protein [Streptomyces sp. TRM 70351]